MYDLIVVGMGAAGCMAGALLQHFDKRVLALEAMDRLGGRVHTAPLGGSVVELGAEWIHGTVDNSVHEYAILENIDVKPQGLVHKVFTSDGLDGNSNLLTDLVEYAFSMVDQPPDLPEPLGQYITRRRKVLLLLWLNSIYITHEQEHRRFDLNCRCLQDINDDTVKDYAKSKHSEWEPDKTFIDNFLRWMNLIIGNHESCAHWDDVSTQTKYEELEGHLQMSWHKHGYHTLLTIILERYKTGCQALEFKMNTEVIHIKLPSGMQDFVEVTCKNGAVYKARAVLVTFSLGVLKERHASLFTPPLPDKKIKAINDISIGVVDKVVFLFEKIWWPTDVSVFAFLWNDQDLSAVPEKDKWTTMIFGASLSMANEKCLVFWISGHEAKLVEILSEEEVRSKLMALLRKFMGRNHVIPEPIEMIRSAWYSNAYTRGSYSFDNIKTPEHPEARADLAEPILDEKGNLRLLFAGEATDKKHFSTVHGAIDSGRREAARFVEADFKLLETEK